MGRLEGLLYLCALVAIVLIFDFVRRNDGKAEGEPQVGWLRMKDRFEKPKPEKPKIGARG
jgi:hypothetical protein